MSVSCTSTVRAACLNLIAIKIGLSIIGKWKSADYSVPLVCGFFLLNDADGDPQDNQSSTQSNCSVQKRPLWEPAWRFLAVLSTVTHLTDAHRHSVLGCAFTVAVTQRNVTRLRLHVLWYDIITQTWMKRFRIDPDIFMLFILETWEVKKEEHGYYMDPV